MGRIRKLTRLAGLALAVSLASFSLTSQAQTSRSETASSYSVILFLRYLGRRIEHQRVKSALQAIVLASAGMLLATALPLAREALSGVLLALIALGSLLILIFTRLDSVWIILGSAVVCLVADAVRAILGA